MQAAPTSTSERTSQSFCQLDESGFGGCRDNVTCLTTAPSVKTDGGETVEWGGGILSRWAVCYLPDKVFLFTE